MSETENLEKLKQALSSYSPEETERVAKDIIEKGVDPLKAVNALTEAVRTVGDKYGRMEIFLAQLIKAGEAMKAGMKVLIPHVPLDKKPKTRKVVIGTVKGDIHDIGKMIVSSMIMAEGFEIHDIGEDAPPSKFFEEAEKIGADIVAASALMTTTRPILKDIIEYFETLGVRNKYKILVGGGTVSAEFAENIGADGYGKDAVDAAKVANKLIPP